MRLSPESVGAGVTPRTGEFIPSRLGDRVPPVETGKAPEASIPTHQAATRFGGSGREVGVVDVIAAQSELTTPVLPPCASARSPWSLLKEAALVDGEQETHRLFEWRWNP